MAAHNRKFFVWEAFVAHVELSSFYKLYDGVAFELEGVLLFVNGCVFAEDSNFGLYKNSGNAKKGTRTRLTKAFCIVSVSVAVNYEIKHRPK